jgi:bifunctional diaminopimelate decarboxylase / aspartate kinase
MRNAGMDQQARSTVIPTWVVLKFGGTSVSTRARWDTIAELATQQQRNGRSVLVVVSALSGVTDQLKALCDAHANEQLSQELMQAIIQRHMRFAHELFGEAATVLGEFELKLSKLPELLRDPRRPSNHFAWQAEVLAQGELLSSSLGALYLNWHWLDARAYLTSVPAQQNGEWANYLSVNCAPAPSLSVQQQMAQLGPILLTQGFIASNLAGQTVILGRGGSDTSAAYFGALLQAQAVEIWTDVPGMFSANPRKAPKARLLKKLDYDEAQEIATTGAKVLHPRCLGPVREFSVPMWIRDTTRPHLAGTQIGPRSGHERASVKAVSVRTGLTLVSMESLGMWQQVGFLSDVFNAFKRHSLSVDLIGSSETNVTISLDPSSNLINANTLELLCGDLAAVCRVKVIAPCAAITLVGRGIRSLLAQLSEVWSELGSERVHLVTQSSNDLNLSIVVDEARADELLPAVHDALLAARVLPMDDPDIIGPAWNELDAPLQAPQTPWWHAQQQVLIDLAQAGPTYVYARNEIAKRLSELKAMNAIDDWFYACKANAFPEVLREIRAAGFGIECVSLAEVHHVRTVLPDLPTSSLLFSPNFAPRLEYREAFELGVQVSLDSTYWLETAPEMLRSRAVHLRLDLGYGGGHHAKVNTGGDRSKFGLSLSDIAKFKQLAHGLQLKIVGLHAHLGSGIRDHDHWPQVYGELASLAEQFPDVTVLNLGGGLGVPSRVGEQRLDLQLVNERLLQLKAMYPHLRVRMEPGRYPIAESGVLLARVTQVKSKGQGRYVGLDTGMNSLIRPALYDAYHEIINLSRLQDEKLWANCTVVGPICETGDVLGHDRLLTVCEENDVMLIAQAGAYGAVMASFYNRRASAREVML